MATSHPDPDVRGRRERLSLHVGGGHHLAQRPRRRVGRDGREGAGPLRRSAGARSPRATDGRRPMPGHIWVDGRLAPADGPHLSAFDRGFQLGDGVFETLRARRAAGRPSSRAPRPAAQRSAADLRSRCPTTSASACRRDRRSACGRRPRRPGPAMPRSASRSSRGAFYGRGLLPPDGIPAHHRRSRRGRSAATGRPPRARASTSSRPRPPRPGEPAGGAEDDLARGLRLRAARGEHGAAPTTRCS